MTHEQLVKLVTLTVKKAIREELQPLKQMILEMKKSNKEIIFEDSKSTKLNQIHRDFRNKVNVQTRPKKNIRFSSNPMLNELLQNTEMAPKETASYLDVFENEDEIINLPTSETGRPVNAPKSVIEAMNRDYSEMFKRDEVRKPQSKQNTNSDFRNKILSQMEPLNEDFQDEDEDLSWLDQVQ